MEQHQAVFFLWGPRLRNFIIVLLNLPCLISLVPVSQVKQFSFSSLKWTFARVTPILICLAWKKSVHILTSCNFVYLLSLAALASSFLSFVLWRVSSCLRKTKQNKAKTFMKLYEMKLTRCSSCLYRPLHTNSLVSRPSRGAFSSLKCSDHSEGERSMGLQERSF